MGLRKRVHFTIACDALVDANKTGHPIRVHFQDLLKYLQIHHIYKLARQEEIVMLNSVYNFTSDSWKENSSPEQVLMLLS